MRQSVPQGVKYQENLYSCGHVIKNPNVVELGEDLGRYFMDKWQ